MKEICFKNSGRVMFVAAMLAGGLTASAQSGAKISVIDGMTDEYGVSYQPVAQAVSPSNKYIAGTASSLETGLLGMFVYDVETKQYVVSPAVDEYGADILFVNDNGVAVGYNGLACTYSIADGKANYIEAEDENTVTQARDASDDLSVIVGCHYIKDDFITTACIWKDGKMIDLPVPTDDELGFETNGSVAYYTNSDGSVIVGYVVDNFATKPMLVWNLQEDGTYVCDPVCAKYFSQFGDLEGRPYLTFSPKGLSHSGKYVSLMLAKMGENDATENFIGRYDLETGELEEYRADGNSSIPANKSMEPRSVSDNGTIVGWMLPSSASMSQRNAIIWKKGEDAQLLTTACPDVPELAEYDIYGFNSPIDITPDGSKVVGFASDGMKNYVSYSLDLGSYASGIVGVDAADGEAAEVARYALDGTRLSAPAKGVNIIKMSDGTTRKVVVK